MNTPKRNYTENETTKLFDNLNVLWYLGSLPGFWITNVKLPMIFQKFYNPYTKILNLVLIVFAFMTIGAFFTQHNLTEQQKNSRARGLTSPITLVYKIILMHHREDIKELLYHLAVTLKEYNDVRVEHKMVLKIKRYTAVFAVLCFVSIVVPGVKATLKVIQGESKFIVFLTAWPDANDPSIIASITRVFIYLIWYIILFQSLGIVIMVLALLSALSYQFRNLNSYFYDLDNIFSKNYWVQDKKEMAYELAFVKGVRWHVFTLRCMKSCKRICRFILSAYLTLGSLNLMSLLPDLMKADSSSRDKLSLVPITVICLILLGIFMWTAGDITVEASQLPEAMYGSGWQHCQGICSERARRLVANAMLQAHRPVKIYAFGYFELSYDAYVTIVKTSYSAFSLLF